MKIVGTITRAHFDGGKSFTLRTDHFGTGAGCHCMRETITRKTDLMRDKNNGHFT